jgi:hypothetical protein
VITKILLNKKIRRLYQVVIKVGWNVMNPDIGCALYHCHCHMCSANALIACGPSHFLEIA